MLLVYYYFFPICHSCMKGGKCAKPWKYRIATMYTAVYPDVTSKLMFYGGHHFSNWFQNCREVLQWGSRTEASCAGILERSKLSRSFLVCIPVTPWVCLWLRCDAWHLFPCLCSVLLFPVQRSLWVVLAGCMVSGATALGSVLRRKGACICPEQGLESERDSE